MARLTWQEMSAPDLGTSLQGYRQFSDLFNSAIAGARSTVNEIDAGMNQRANEGALRLAAAVQDPEQAKQLLASDAIMANTRLNAPTIAQLAMRPAQLTQQQAGELALSDAQYASDQTRLRDERAPLIAQARMFAQADDKAGLQKFLTANPTLMQGLGYKTMNDFITDLQADTKGAVGIAGQRIDQTIAQANESRNAGRYKWEESDRNDQTNAARAIQAVFENATDANSARDLLKGMNLSPRAYGLAVQTLGGQFKGLVGDATITGDPTSAGGLQDYSNVPFASVRSALLGSEGPGHLGGYDALAYNTPGGGNDAGVKPPKPVSQMTLGELYDFQTGPMRAKTRGRRGAKDVGSTGAGAYQFESQTLADTAQKVFGANWRNVQFSGANQDKLAENLYNRVRGNAVALGNTWNVFRGNGLDGAAKAAQVEIAGRRSQNNVTSAQRAWVEKLNDPRDIEQVIADLQKTPSFKGVSANYIRNQILQGMQRTPGANAGQVGEILKQSIGSGEEGFFGGLNWFGRNVVDAVLPNFLKDPSAPNLGNGRRIDYGMRDSKLREVRSGNVIDHVLNDQALGDTSASITALQQVYDRANAAYNAALTSPDSRAKSQIDQLQRERDRAQTNLGIALASHTNNPNSQFQADRPQPVGKSTGGTPSVGQRISGILGDIASGELFRIRRGNE